MRSIVKAFRTTQTTNRRTFLKQTFAASAALLALNDIKLRANWHSEMPKITIIGAGISGLSAAYYLKKAGINADIFEGSFRVGGRMFTYQNVFDKKISTDLGGEFIDTNHLSLINLAKELGVELYDLANDPLEENIILFGQKRYSQADIAAAISPYIPIFEKDLKNLPDDFHYSNNESFKELDNLSVTEYLESRQVKGWIKDFIEVTITTEYGREASEQSALNFLTILETSTKSDEDYKLLGAEHETFKYKGGAESLISKLNEKVKEQVQLHHLLTKIESNTENGKTKLYFSSPEGDKMIETDIVLLTLPFSVLRNITLDFPMSEAKRMAINELGYSSARKFIMGFNKKTWREIGTQGYLYSDLSIPSGWDSAQMQNTKKGAFTIFLGGKSAQKAQNQTDEENINTFLGDLDQIFPNSKKQFNNKTLQFVWEDYPYSLGAYSVYLKGQWSKFVGAEAENCENIYFAGEHTSIEFQGFMNGAVESALRATKQILNKLKDKND